MMLYCTRRFFNRLQDRCSAADFLLAFDIVIAPEPTLKPQHPEAKRIPRWRRYYRRLQAAGRPGILPAGTEAILIDQTAQGWHMMPALADAREFVRKARESSRP